LAIIGTKSAGFGGHRVWFFISAAKDNLFIVFGAWMESSFGLGLASLGFAAGIIGAAELMGEGITILVSDRIGLKRATIIGAVLTSMAYILLLFAQQTIFIALAALFVLFMAFEFTMVSLLSLCTAIHPSARATMMAGFYAVGALGRVAGTLAGGLHWTFFGWTTVCIVSAVVNGIGLLLLIWGIQNRTDTKCPLP